MSKNFLIDTRPTKELLVTNLTKDASTEACIFDLVDNSIDAARNTFFRAQQAPDSSDEPPGSYKGFAVNLVILADKVDISDNCGGMDSTGLASEYLRFGKQSEHPFGIGLYGVGLNRAMFKLGSKVQICTEDTKSRLKVEIDRDAYIADEQDWHIVGHSIALTGVHGTNILIENLDAEISRQTASMEWRAALIREMEKRYARFLSKGLVIAVNGENLKANIVSLRVDGPFPTLTKFFRIDGETSVSIEAGQHEKHRFPAELDYDLKVNRLLADQYGWSIVCNDRVIVHLDTSPKTGWDKKWHNEFSGFVGIVHFVSKDPKKLPWNTPKTDVDVNNPNYQSVLTDMRSFTEQWRANANQAKKKKKAGEQLRPPTRSRDASIGNVSKNRINNRALKITSTPEKSRAIVKPSQTKLRFVLPSDIDERFCRDKLLQLVHEAKNIDLFVSHYSGLALIRMLFETAAKGFLVRHNVYKEVILKIVQRREDADGKTLPEKRKKELVPSIDEIVWVFSEDPSLWRGGVGKPMNQSLGKFAKHKERMNSAIHHPFQVINVYEALQIRDDVLPVLRHLIEE